MTVRKIVEVEWVDSLRSMVNWGKPPPEVFEMSTCRTAGFLLKSGKKSVTVALNVDDTNENVADTMTIPRCSIRRIEVLKTERVKR